MPDLTSIERTAAETLRHENESSGEYHDDAWTAEDFAHTARAVVAAVRPAILHEAAELLRQRAASPTATAQARNALNRTAGYLDDHAAQLEESDA